MEEPQAKQRLYKVDAAARPEVVDAELDTEERGTFLALGTRLLENRWKIARWMLIGGVLASLWVFLYPRQYIASSLFMPQSGSSSSSTRSGLASIAGQFGVSLPSSSGSDQTFSPDFYMQLLTSRVILEPIARDTFTVPELGGKRIAMVDLFKAKGTTTAQRQERGMKILQQDIITPIENSTTGTVQVKVTTRWRSVSLAMVQQVIGLINRFNSQTRQSQASVERQFLERRLQGATADLRAAEGRMQSFLSANRDIGSSAALMFQHDNLQRDLTTQQQIYAGVIQSLEDAKVREVRDTPVITLVEPPTASVLPVPRNRLLIFIGLFLGLTFGTILALTRGMIGRRRAEGDAAAAEFATKLEETKADLLRPVRWLRRRSAR